MITKEYRELIDKITLRTVDGKIKWETTSDRNKYLCKIGDNTITVRSYIYNYNPEGVDFKCISFEILDILGDLIDGVYVDETEDDYGKMTELYDMARRNALNIDQTIRDLLNALE